MTAPKGTRREQVQRLKMRAIEAFVRKLEDKKYEFWPSHEELKEFRELCAAADSPDERELDEIRKRLAALEISVGQVQGQAMETADGELRMG